MGRTEKSGSKTILVTDYYTYNTKTQQFGSQGLHWVGDLALETELKVESDTGTITLLLIEAGRRHQCEIDLASGIATLSIDAGQLSFDPTSPKSATQISAQTKIKGKGTYDVRFANVDNQLTLWVNNRVCDFGQPATYMVQGPELPTNEDLAPVRIGATDAKISVKNLRVLRDVYYLAVRYSMNQQFDYDYTTDFIRTLQAAMMEPESYDELFESRRAELFKLEEDQYFPMGDNSPMSKDARLWDPPHFVHRDMLIGKAVLVYWPHPIHVKIPLTNTTIPAFPNFKRMKLIR